jgi:hypothetical protein
MLIVSTIGAASGKAGGLVASHGRTGQLLRAGRPARQPRSSSQQSARALTGGMASAWRSLATADQSAWSALASCVARTDRLGRSFHPSAYALYVSCNRNLATLGLPPLSGAAPSVPSFPALLSLSATPVFLDPDSLSPLIGLTFNYSPTVSQPWAGVIRASAGVSAGRGNVRPSDLRIIAALNPLPSVPVDLFAPWVAVWGMQPPIGQITFSLNLVDTRSGFASASIRATLAYTGVSLNPYVPGPILIEFNGTPEAVIPNEVIEFNSNPQAGG